MPLKERFQKSVWRYIYRHFSDRRTIHAVFMDKSIVMPFYLVCVCPMPDNVIQQTQQREYGRDEVASLRQVKSGLVFPQ